MNTHIKYTVRKTGRDVYLLKLTKFSGCVEQHEIRMQLWVLNFNHLYYRLAGKRDLVELDINHCISFFFIDTLSGILNKLMKRTSF